MTRAEFDEFINRQQRSGSSASTSFDPERELAEWRSHLRSLYETVHKFMATYIEQQSAEIVFHDVQLNEEFSGPYDVQQMSLIMGRSTVVFKPVGTMLIGSKGRVDVQGPRGSARLILVNRKTDHARQMFHVNVHAGPSASHALRQSDAPIEWTWKIVAPAPQMRFIDLTENHFFDMILSIVDA